MEQISTSISLTVEPDSNSFPQAQRTIALWYSGCIPFFIVVISPSNANFLLIEPKCESRWLFEELIKEGILVRNVSNYSGLGNHLRISIGKPEENKILIEVLKKIL